jgi:hypothetical protein
MSAIVAEDAWRAIAAHYQRLATQRSAEGPGVQLACLVLADYCASLWTGARGPSLAMVALAEHILGDRVDEVVAAELIKLDSAREEAS